MTRRWFISMDDAFGREKDTIILWEGENGYYCHPSAGRWTQRVPTPADMDGPRRELALGYHEVDYKRVEDHLREHGWKLPPHSLYFGEYRHARWFIPKCGLAIVLWTCDKGGWYGAPHSGTTRLGQWQNRDHNDGPEGELKRGYKEISWATAESHMKKHNLDMERLVQILANEGQSPKAKEVEWTYYHNRKLAGGGRDLGTNLPAAYRVSDDPAAKAQCMTGLGDWCESHQSPATIRIKCLKVATKEEAMDGPKTKASSRQCPAGHGRRKMAAQQLVAAMASSRAELDSSRALVSTQLVQLQKRADAVGTTLDTYKRRQVPCAF